MYYAKKIFATLLILFALFAFWAAFDLKDTGMFIFALLPAGLGALLWVKTTKESSSWDTEAIKEAISGGITKAKNTKAVPPLYVDTLERTWKNGLTGSTYAFNQLRKYELVEVGDIDSKIHMKGGVSLGRAVVGHSLLGLLECYWVASQVKKQAQ